MGRRIARAPFRRKQIPPRRDRAGGKPVCGRQRCARPCCGAQPRGGPRLVRAVLCGVRGAPRSQGRPLHRPVGADRPKPARPWGGRARSPVDRGLSGGVGGAGGCRRGQVYACGCASFGRIGAARTCAAVRAVVALRHTRPPDGRCENCLLAKARATLQARREHLAPLLATLPAERREVCRPCPAARPSGYTEKRVPAACIVGAAHKGRRRGAPGPGRRLTARVPA